MPEIAIGTAQFGLDYGVANRNGQVGASVVQTILGHATIRGCNWIDTAVAYGEAERVLGQVAATEAFHICSKVGADASGDPDDLEHELTKSLARLGRSSLDILLLHRSDWLRDDRASTVREWAERERSAGRIRAFGVSVYGVDEIDAVLGGGVDWVQLPVSILAQDWLRTDWLDRLRTANIRIQARSILAQGLVAVDPAELPAPLAALREPLAALHQAARQLGKSPVALALRFAARAPIDMMVIGVETREQLDDCLDAVHDCFELPWAEFACADARATDPRFWPKGMRVAA